MPVIPPEANPAALSGERNALFSSSINPPASNKRRKRNQSISDRKSREGSRRHVATEGFCVARVAGSGSCCPQYAQFAQVGSTGLSHFGHVGCSKVPQRGQNGNFAFSTCPQPGHVIGRGSRRMKYKIIPIAWGTKIASSRLRSPKTLTALRVTEFFFFNQNKKPASV